MSTLQRAGGESEVLVLEQAIGTVTTSSRSEFNLLKVFKGLSTQLADALFTYCPLVLQNYFQNICRRSGTDLKERLAPNLLMRGLDQAGR